MKRWTTLAILAGALLLPPTLSAVADNDKLTTSKNTTAVAPKASEPGNKFGPGLTDPLKADSKKFGPGVTKPKEDITGLGVDAWRLWLVVIVLAAMLGGMLYILRKYGRGILPSNNADIIKVKAKIQLDAKNSVAVLRIYDEEYVIGAGGNGVTLLTRLMPIDGLETEPENTNPPNDTEDGNKNLRRTEQKIEEDFNARFKNMVEHEEVK